ncbi:FAD-binding protein [Prescottella agglutinans]|uniref:3-oxosteroid 1-dehydrogenase n=1 Tax=Prescottella agglutinans TaxID=1644129 RepID=A0A3S3ACG1_9NOCA|nr:FAD-binding protein [Prescottella agglutinans]RVW06994.1 FAD-binding protein [Prescottella agglutinans]
MAENQNFDTVVDFLVVGSGGGGMAAGITAADRGMSALIIDKGKTYGGSTAISGGGIWIPNAPVLVRKGAGDSRESVRRYLDVVTEGKVSDERLDAYVDNGPPMMELLERSPHIEFYWVKGYADYHPEEEGGRPLGRTVECTPFDTRKLGEDEKYQRPNSLKGPLGLWVTSKDYHDLAMVKRTWQGRRASLVAAWRVSSNVIRRRHMSTGGRALVARMRMALKDAGVPLWLQTSMKDLIVDDKGAVIGITAEREGKTVRIGARKGVLLATGGFDHNKQMRAQYLPENGVENYSAGARENVGDGIVAGQKLGAAVDLMDDAWWMPSVMHPMGAVIPLVSERSIPPSVIVNKDGKRFTNESAPYVNFVHDQLDGGHVPAYFIMDSKARSRYPFAQVLPGAPFPQGFYDKGIVHKANSLSELAEKIGVPPQNLLETVDRFNGYARTGKDEEFGRGDSVYDQYYGDPTMKNPAMDEIVKGPFYAIRVEAGDLGTKGGLVTDAEARVLREDGGVIEGLYATGNTSASVMANEYAGAGATIGPSMVFGYVAANHVADTASDRLSGSNAK